MCRGSLCERENLSNVPHRIMPGLSAFHTGDGNKIILHGELVARSCRDSLYAV